MTEAERLWILCSQALRIQVAEATWKTWFETINPLRVDDDALVLAVPSSLAKERLDGRYLSLVQDALAGASGTNLDVRIEVRATEAQVDEQMNPQQTPEPDAQRRFPNQCLGGGCIHRSLPLHPRP